MYGCCSIVLWSSKNEEVNLSHEFIFVFIFFGAILLKKILPKMRSLKKGWKGGWPYRGLYIGGSILLQTTCFLFHLKSSFNFQDIKIFVLTFWLSRKKASLERQHEFQSLRHHSLLNNYNTHIVKYLKKYMQSEN